MVEHILLHRLTMEGLPRRIDILAAYLEEIIFFAQPHEPAQLILRIAARHICDSIEAYPCYLSEKRIEIIVLDFLRFLIPRNRISHISEITGEITTDEILGEIFGRFCIGK